MSLSANQLIPDDLQAELQSAGDEADAGVWRIGDIVVELESEMPGVPRYLLWQAAGQFCNREPYTVKDYAYTSRHVPRDVRSAYSMLGRHHFKAMIPHVDTHGGWDALIGHVLAWSDDYGGMITPVHVVRARLNGHEDRRPRWLVYALRVRVLAGRLVDEADTPPLVRAACRALLAAMEGV